MPKSINFIISHILMAVLICGSLSLPASAQSNDPKMDDIWHFARSENSVNAYKLFLLAYPNSDMAEEAMQRIAALEAGSKPESQIQKASARGVSRVKGSPVGKVEEEAIFDLIGPVSLREPFQFGSEAILGLRIEEVLFLSPIYSPIEGLPKELWATQSCSACHDWTPERLCTQGTTYIEADAKRYQEKQHPFGGSFKINLRQWALNDCR